MIVHRYGTAALLAEPADPRAVLPLAEALRTAPGVLEVVPAARTVLVRAGAADLPALHDRLLSAEEHLAVRPPAGPEVVLDVTYDGPDLADTAELLGMPATELVHLHTGGTYVVAFCGFAPGFAYLTGLPPGLHAPRLAEPRARVPAGAVGIAGEFTGAYPRPSPGGWRLLGHTDAQLWDPHRNPPALLAPGTRVRFRAR